MGNYNKIGSKSKSNTNIDKHLEINIRSFISIKNHRNHLGYSSINPSMNLQTQGYYQFLIIMNNTIVLNVDI